MRHVVPKQLGLDEGITSWDLKTRIPRQNYVCNPMNEFKIPEKENKHIKQYNLIGHAFPINSVWMKELRPGT